MKNFQAKPNITDVNIFALEDSSETSAKKSLKCTQLKYTGSSFTAAKQASKQNLMQKTHICMYPCMYGAFFLPHAGCLYLEDQILMF